MPFSEINFLVDKGELLPYRGEFVMGFTSKGEGVCVLSFDIGDDVNDEQGE